MRQPINFDWLYSTDFKEAYKTSLIQGGTKVDIPHTNIELPVNCINEKQYQFTSTYQKVLHFDKSQLEKRIFFYFEGCAHWSEVYLNGSLLGIHKCGYTPFEFEATGAKDGENLLTVVVNSSEELNTPPFGKVIDFLTFGGMYREAEIRFKTKNYIQDVYVYGKSLLDSPSVVFEVEMACEYCGELSFTLENGGKSVVFSGAIDGTRAVLEFAYNGLKLWDIDDPQLYTVKVSAQGCGDFTVTTGFRDAHFTPQGFVLNGRKLDIIGLSRHQSYPIVGYAMPKSAQVADAYLLKHELGCNMVRTSHYPQSRHFLDACDQLGLLVIEEIPGWQNVGDSEWKAISLQTVGEMVLCHRNHPSIVLWGTRINESLDDNELYRETSALARRLDPVRQVGGTRNIEMVKPDKNAWLEDVYTYNDFMYWPGHPLTDVDQVFPVPDIAGIVTEHSGHTFPTKSFDNEERRLTHALRHLDIINYMKGDSRIAGTLGWCAFDYNTHIEFGSGDRICYHGVMDIFRMPKLCAYGYKMQSSDEIVLETSTNFTIGEYDRAVVPDAYIFTNADYVEVFRNGTPLGKMYPDKKRFHYLDHPPIEMDWFGDILIHQEGFSKEKSDLYKQIHNVYLHYHIGGEPEQYKELMKDREVIDAVVALHNKYIQNWSNKAVSYKIVGYKDGRAVKEIIRGGEYGTKLRVQADTNQLTEQDTYDVVRVSCELVNENGYRLAYAQEVVSVDAGESLELIGPSLVPLTGGARAFWLKTRKGVKGKAFVTVKCAGHSAVLEFTIR